MNNCKGQITLILILMLAIFLQIEGVIPDIFATSDEPIVMTNEKEGLDFNVTINSKSFTEKDKLIIKVSITNKSNNAICYYSGTSSYGKRGVLRADLYSKDGSSKFTDKFNVDTTGISTDASLFRGELLTGKTISCDFFMLPYFMDKGAKHSVSSGKYILKLWYRTDTERYIEAEFPVTLIRRFGRMHLKG